MTDTQNSAINALREAASALNAGRDAGDAHGQLPARERAAIASGVANVLDSLIGLLRAIDYDAAMTTEGTTDLDPVLVHLAAGSTLARSMQDRGPGPLPARSLHTGESLGDR